MSVAVSGTTGCIFASTMRRLPSSISASPGLTVISILGSGSGSFSAGATFSTAAISGVKLRGSKASSQTQAEAQRSADTTKPAVAPRMERLVTVAGHA